MPNYFMERPNNVEFSFAHLAPCLRGAPVMRSPIGVISAEQVVYGDDFPNAAETARAAFLLDKKHRVILLVASSMVTMRSHSCPGTHLRRFPSRGSSCRARFPLPSLPVGVTARCLLDHSGFLKAFLVSGVAATSPVSPVMGMEMADNPPVVALPVPLCQRQHLICRCPAMGFRGPLVS